MTNFYDRTASVTDVLNNLRWDSLKLRRKRNGLAMMYMLNDALAEIGKCQVSRSSISRARKLSFS